MASVAASLVVSLAFLNASMVALMVSVVASLIVSMVSIVPSLVLTNGDPKVMVESEAELRVSVRFLANFRNPIFCVRWVELALLILTLSLIKINE